MVKALVAVLGGALLGVIGARFLFVGSGLSLIPWAVAALALGIWCSSWRQALAVGAAFGFSLAFVFMLAGYAGAAPLSTRVLPFAALGVVGAGFGLALSCGGYVARTRLFRRDQQPT